MLNTFQASSMFLTFTVHIIENVFTHTPICALISTYHIQHKMLIISPTPPINMKYWRTHMSQNHGIPTNYFTSGNRVWWAPNILSILPHVSYMSTRQSNKSIKFKKSHIRISSLTHLPLSSATRFVVYIIIATKFDS
jgi:hypothetical protein